MNDTVIITTNALQKSFGQYEVLNGLSVSISKGIIYGLLGENGAGKTTFMKILIGLLKPSKGDVYICGKNIAGQDRKYLSKIGSLIEVPAFYEWLTVGENLSLHCDYLSKSNYDKIPGILDAVGIPGTENKKIKELSLGMMQRLAIGRALLGEPEILILDEPINGIDPKGIIEIRNLLLQLKREQALTILLSSHIISELEKIADIIGIMHNGKIISEIPKAIFEKDDFDFEKQFLTLTQNLNGERVNGN
ncbi:MAG: ATP-binding cassette domain-containing protein [Epulopiscium sp.]|nr:ATP-binding cassette domain-containing protein [Candidatus Epulonipiscium sp.]